MTANQADGIPSIGHLTDSLAKGLIGNSKVADRIKNHWEAKETS